MLEELTAEKDVSTVNTIKESIPYKNLGPGVMNQPWLSKLTQGNLEIETQQRSQLRMKNDQNSSPSSPQKSPKVKKTV